jgi:hypothetical protein
MPQDRTLYRIEHSLRFLDKQYHILFIEYFYTGVPPCDLNEIMGTSGFKFAMDAASGSSRGFFFNTKRDLPPYFY